MKIQSVLDETLGSNPQWQAHRIQSAMDQGGGGSNLQNLVPAIKMLLL